MVSGLTAVTVTSLIDGRWLCYHPTQTLIGSPSTASNMIHIYIIFSWIILISLNRDPRHRSFKCLREKWLLNWYVILSLWGPAQTERCRLMTFWCITPTLHTHWREFRKYLSSSHPPRDHRHSSLEKEWRGRWLETDLEDCWDIRTSHPAISNLLSCPGMFSRPDHLCGIKHSSASVTRKCLSALQRV